MDANEIQVGFLKVRPKLDTDGDQIYHVRWEDEAGKLLKKPVVEETQQAHGYRIMHVDMLGRMTKRLTDLGLEDHTPGIVGWLMGTPPPDPKRIKPMVTKLKKLEQEYLAKARTADSRADRRMHFKDSRYFEAAAFCWFAWLPAE